MIFQIEQPIRAQATTRLGEAVVAVAEHRFLRGGDTTNFGSLSGDYSGARVKGTF